MNLYKSLFPSPKSIFFCFFRRASNTVSEHLTEASQSVLERHERNSQRQAQQAAAAAAVSTAQQQLAAASGSSSR